MKGRKESVTDTRAKLSVALSVILIPLLSIQTDFPSLSSVCRRIQHTTGSKRQSGEIFSTRKGTPRRIGEERNCTPVRERDRRRADPMLTRVAYARQALH